MITHEQIWDALDALAAKQGLSPSALAKRAGLDPTAFNKSKRVGPEGSRRPRWPSTESLAKVLDATGASLEDFASLLQGVEKKKTIAPSDPNAVLMIGLKAASSGERFDTFGTPTGAGWQSLSGADIKPQSAFALEVEDDSLEPVYRQGDKLIVAPGEPVRQGQRVVVCTRQGELLVKTLGRRSPTQIELRPLHTHRPQRTLKSDDFIWVSRIISVTQ